MEKINKTVVLDNDTEIKDSVKVLKLYHQFSKCIILSVISKVFTPFSHKEHKLASINNRNIDVE